MNVKMITNGELRHLVDTLSRAKEELELAEAEDEYFVGADAYELIDESLIIVVSLLEGVRPDE